jgi:hypothetical protein
MTLLTVRWRSANGLRKTLAIATASAGVTLAAWALIVPGARAAMWPAVACLVSGSLLAVSRWPIHDCVVMGVFSSIPAGVYWGDARLVEVASCAASAVWAGGQAVAQEQPYRTFYVVMTAFSALFVGLWLGN